LGQTFDGLVTGVSEWGIYLEDKETKCEGMVRLMTMTDDFYSLDKKKYAIIGEKTGKKYSLGDSVKFKVMNADLEKRMLDYSIVP
jgi:exoribonuclease R